MMEDYKDEGQEHNTPDTRITFVWDQSATPLSFPEIPYIPKFESLVYLSPDRCCTAKVSIITVL